MSEKGAAPAQRLLFRPRRNRKACLSTPHFPLLIAFACLRGSAETPERVFPGDPKKARRTFWGEEAQAERQSVCTRGKRLRNLPCADEAELRGLLPARANLRAERLCVGLLPRSVGCGNPPKSLKGFSPGNPEKARRTFWGEEAQAERQSVCTRGKRLRNLPCADEAELRGLLPARANLRAERLCVGLPPRSAGCGNPPKPLKGVPSAELRGLSARSREPARGTALRRADAPSARRFVLYAAAKTPPKADLRGCFGSGGGTRTYDLSGMNRSL